MTTTTPTVNEPWTARSVIEADLHRAKRTLGRLRESPESTPEEIAWAHGQVYGLTAAMEACKLTGAPIPAGWNGVES